MNKISCINIVLLATLGGGETCMAQRMEGKPNVIYIYADDMGKGMLSAYGQKMFSTPHIDSLIRKGVSFSNAYGCMLSAPSRASLLTGYHDCHTNKWRIGRGGLLLGCSNEEEVRNVEENINRKDVILPEGDYYLPQVFKQAGYVTAQIGKLEWGFTATRKQMRVHGWDYYYGYLDHVRCHGYYPPFLFDNGKMVRIEGNIHKDCGKTIEPETERAYQNRWDMTGKKVYSQDIFNEKIIRFIRENKDRPFFLYHPTQLPHGPVSIPEVYPEIDTNRLLTPIEKEYASMVKRIDEQVGIIMKELRRLGLEENTIVVFAADNGHEIYYEQKGRCEKPYRNMATGKLFDNYRDKYYSALSGDIFNGNAGMAGLKRSNLEGGVRIPLVMRWKGKMPAGKVCRELVSNYDFLPTMADLLKVKLQSKKDGVSLLPLIFSGKSLKKDRYIVFNSIYGPAIVKNDGWKLRYFKEADHYELYYLPDDYQESLDLSNQYPEKVEKLIKLLQKECEINLR